MKEEERDESEVPGIIGGSVPHHPPHALGLLPSGSCEEDPQAILDEHLSRVLKTPGCQSPGVPTARYSPRSRSPDRCASSAAASLILGAGGPLAYAGVPTASAAASANKGAALALRQATKHIHHHYIHHHHAASPKTKEQIEAEAAQRVAQCLCPSTAAATGADYAYQRCHSPAEFSSG